MPGIWLLLDLEGKLTFETEKLLKCLKGLPGVFNWTENETPYLFFCEYRFEGDCVTAHMFDDDSQFISIDGLGIAGLSLAIEIQRSYAKDIHLVDPECSFDIILSSVSSVDDLKNKIDLGWGSENFKG